MERYQHSSPRRIGYKGWITVPKPGNVLRYTIEGFGVVGNMHSEEIAVYIGQDRGYMAFATATRNFNWKGPPFTDDPIKAEETTAWRNWWKLPGE